MMPRYKDGTPLGPVEADMLARAFAYKSWKEMESHAAGAEKQREEKNRRR